MIETLYQSLFFPGLVWLLGAAFVGGLVRGFTGFGTAMVFIPVASLFLTPVSAIAALVVMDIFGPAPLLRRAWRAVDRAELGRLVLGGLIGIPLGTLALTALDPVAFRWGVSATSLTLLAVLASGWRYEGRPTARLVLAIGFAAGFLGGLAGLPGPIVILFYLSGRRAIAEIRGVSLLFLFSTDVVLIATFWLRGLIGINDIALGLICAIPLAIGAVLGQTLFRPEQARLFRAVAYGLIAVAAISGLPVFDGAR
ncbi:sulfite exporter TauE/SafE family protein [Abyssibius alkaniclasticus]|uniref:sulfite exporter TauE/SafE family protein n=1 Tax=Abyssibius alkaniclasticus TaxID=2881234 RepID=UPI00405A36CA